MKQRNQKIDYIKAIGVIGVMVMHLHTPIKYIAPLITNFYIPIFFICSGYTTSPDKIISLKKKFSSLMFPYLFYYVFFFILTLLGFVKAGQNECWGFLYSRFQVEEINLQSLYIAPSWFLSAMLITFSLYKLVSHLNVSIHLKALMSGTIGILVANYCKINLPWSLENAIMLLSYIYIGQILRIYINTQKKYIWIIALMIIYSYFSIYNGNVSLSLSDYGSSIVLCYVLPIMAFYILFKLLPSSVSNLNERKFFRLGSYIGQNSLTIFMSHMLFYGIYKYTLDNNILASIHVFQRYHFLLQGGIVCFTVITTVLTCKWQSLFLAKIKVFSLENGNSNKQ